MKIAILIGLIYISATVCTFLESKVRIRNSKIIFLSHKYLNNTLHINYRFFNNQKKL